MRIQDTVRARRCRASAGDSTNTDDSEYDSDSISEQSGGEGVQSCNTERASEARMNKMKVMDLGKKKAMLLIAREIYTARAA
jgi:hypothetical protein